MGRTPRDSLPPNKLAFSYRDTADATGLTRYSVARLVQDGTLKTAKIAGHRKITRASLAAFIHELADPSATEAA